MEHTWRWFGPRDPVTLAQIRQSGASGVVTALHDIPNGEVWPVPDIMERKELIEAAGLTWSVVESIPVHEDIKRGNAGAQARIAAWATTLRNLATCGIEVVCYNFMPILDWTRTDLTFRLPNGAWTPRFSQDAFAAFDLYVLRRPGAHTEYDPVDRRRARAYADSLDQPARERLARTVIAGLPGAEESYTLEALRADLAAYHDVDQATLRANLRAFLIEVVPVAAEVGIRLGIHPDDPPRPLLGLPRVASTAADLQLVLAAVDEPANGLTFCAGSLGERADNDVVAMAREFAPRIHFAHLRSVRRAADGRSFYETGTLDGDVDLVGVLGELVREERRRERMGGARLPMRADHGQQILTDQWPGQRSNPGYPLVGRAKSLAELRGIETTLQRLAA